LALVVINCYVLDVFPLMICVPLHIDYYILLLDITLMKKKGRHKLQEGYFKCSRKILCRFQLREVRSHASVRTSLSIVLTLISQATSILTTWLFRPDSHQCLEVSNCSSLHPSRRSSEFQKNPTFKCISESVQTTWLYRLDAN